jgi:hypothetical protein
MRENPIAVCVLNTKTPSRAIPSFRPTRSSVRVTHQYTSITLHSSLPKYQPRLQSTITSRTNKRSLEIIRAVEEWIISHVIRKYFSTIFYCLQLTTNFYFNYTPSSGTVKNTRRKNTYMSTFLLNWRRSQPYSVYKRCSDQTPKLCKLKSIYIRIY